MKRQITKTITTGLVVSFLAGIIYMFAVYAYYDAQNSNNYTDGRRKMDCFGGLQYIILIGINIFIAISNSTAFLNLFKPIRTNKYYSFLAFFAPYLIYLNFVFTTVSHFSIEKFLMLIPIGSISTWVIYYFKLRKIA